MEVSRSSWIQRADEISKHHAMIWSVNLAAAWLLKKTRKIYLKITNKKYRHGSYKSFVLNNKEVIFFFYFVAFFQRQ